MQTSGRYLHAMLWLVMLTLPLGALAADGTGSARAMLNVWHIPQNYEPPSVTMRNPLQPDTTTNTVYIYVGGYPAGACIWSGTLHYRLDGVSTWSADDFQWDSNVGNNQYFIAQFDNTFNGNDTIEYYLELHGDPGATDVTFVYGNNSSSNTTTDEPTAQAAPYTFTITDLTTPAATATPEPTATPLPLVNAWHIPDNVEPSPVTMRNPLNPDANDVTVYIYTGAFPQSTLHGANLHYRKAGDATWTQTAFSFDTNQGSNEYWLAYFSNVYAEGDTVEYYLYVYGDPEGYTPTFIYWHDDASSTTASEATAQAEPFSFVVAPASGTPAPTVTATPTVTPMPLMNVWHIPDNVEPSPVTMRNPLDPDANDVTIYIYAGAFPQGSIHGANLHYRKAGDPGWNETSFTFDANQGSNEYWRAFFNNSYAEGDTVEYYLYVYGDPMGYVPTYVYWHEDASTTTASEATAQAEPFSFVVAPASGTPAPTVTATPTVTPMPLMNVWHIPDNVEPSPVTMRNPLNPDADDTTIYIYTGAFPQGAIHGGTLFFREAGAMSWDTAVFNFDSNSGSNEYWMASFVNSFDTGDTVEYYLHLYGDPMGYVPTYVYWHDDASTTTASEATAQAEPFGFTIQAVQPTTVPTVGPSPTPGVPLPLLNVWHIASNNEPRPVTMRNPAMPDTDDTTIYIYAGGYPQGTMWGGTLYYRVQGAVTWDDATLNFDTNQYGNEYWMASFTNSFSGGQVVEYILEINGNPLTSGTTYLYGDDFTSNSTGEMATAEADPFGFEVLPVPTPVPTGTPGPLPLVNAWHLPPNNEPPGVTMRNPHLPAFGDDPVYIYVGAYPQGTLWNGTLHFREQGGTWDAATFAWDSNAGVNEYWFTDFANAYTAGTTVEYYLEVAGDPGVYRTTYIYGDDVQYSLTSEQSEAEAAPYTFVVLAVPTPGPTPTVMPNLLNVWHLPVNEEPPSVTMRNPVTPRDIDDPIYFYVGAYPQSTIWSGSVYYRLQGAGTWDTTALAFDTNNGANEYWITNITNTFGIGDTVEYFFAVAGDPGTYNITYIFGDDTHSNISGNQATAESAPYIFTIAGSPTPGPTPTPGANLLNVWHIPSNNEPPSVTMRNPLEVHGSDSIIYVYAGGYPQTSIWSGTVYYRAQGVGPWQTTALTFDSNQGPNEYWLASFPNSFLLGTTVEYFLALEGDPETYATTYIYGDDGTSATTDLQTTAQVGAYTFTITAQPTPGPTVTPCNPVNAWHIPVNNEPPFPDITMRRPLLPLVSDENIYFYLGSYPVSTVWDEYTDLFYRKQGSSSWSLADFNFDTVHGVNEYWLATVANTFAVGDVVEYYLRVTANETYDVTYIYGDDTHSNRTCSEAEARQFPYTFPVGGAAAVPATGPAGLLLLLVAIGGLMGVATRKR